MSEGPRMPLAAARSIAEGLIARWKLDPSTTYVVGSIRRGVDLVGDVELLAPLPRQGQADTLFDAICASVDNPPPATTMFQPMLTPARDAIGTAVRGLKPGFLACDIVVRAWQGKPHAREVKVQVFRYTRENLGWMLIEKTGPMEFGRHFLLKWKQRHGIAVGEGGGKASIENHLVDADRKVISVPSEVEAFERCQMKWIDPRDREAAARAAAQMSGPARRIA